MAYHWGDERRLFERRRAIDPNYRGPERRDPERRQHPPERKSPMTYILIGLIVFVLVDTMVWHGFYCRAVLSGINDMAARTRYWSDNLWKFG